MAMKRLIINADDLGLSQSVNRGIERAYREGVLSSATLMANMPGFEGGVEVALNNPGLGVGVHLNIIRGLPLSEPDTVFPLLAEGGKFIDRIFRIRRMLKTPGFLAAAEREYRAQIERVLRSGVSVDHLDFEKHHGLWQELYGLGEKLAEEYGLAIRSYREPLFFILQNCEFPGIRDTWNSLHLLCYNRLFHKQNKKIMPDYFFGQSHIGKVDSLFLSQLITSLPEGVSELMTHPGCSNLKEEREIEAYAGSSWINAVREAEMEALCDQKVKDLLAQSDVELCTFAACFGGGS